MQCIFNTYFPPASRFHRRSSHRSARRGSRFCTCNVRRSYAHAELFIEDKLYCGYQPDFIENKVRTEIAISKITGEFCLCYLHFCLRILGNLRRSGQLVCLLPLAAEFEEHERIVMKDGVLEHDYSFRQDFREKKVVEVHGKDPEIVREIERSEPLDEDTVIELRQLRDGLYDQAEKEYQSRKKSMLEGGSVAPPASSPRRFKSRDGRERRRRIEDGRASSTSSSSTARPQRHRNPKDTDQGGRSSSSGHHETRDKPSSVGLSDSVSQSSRRLGNGYDPFNLRRSSPGQVVSNRAPGWTRAPSRIRSRRDIGYDMADLSAELLRLDSSPNTSSPSSPRHRDRSRSHHGFSRSETPRRNRSRDPGHRKALTQYGNKPDSETRSSSTADPPRSRFHDERRRSRRHRPRHRDGSREDRRRSPASSSSVTGTASTLSESMARELRRDREREEDRERRMDLERREAREREERRMERASARTETQSSTSTAREGRDDRERRDRRR